MMKKTLLAVAIAASVTATAFAADYASHDITGVWQTKTGGYVQIYQSGGGFDGIIVGSRSGKARYDSQNPDQSKRGRRLLGLTILHGLKAEGDGEYGGGHIYDPNSGKTYKAKAKLAGPDTLDARGYIGFSLLGKTQTWHRINSHAPNVHQDLLHKPIGNQPQTSASR